MTRKARPVEDGLTAIEWIGGERFVPYVGMVKTGDVLPVPAAVDELAAGDFIRQGLARAADQGEV